jgi:hypothetical protein
MGALQGNLGKTISAQPTATVLVALLGFAMLWAALACLAPKRLGKIVDELSYIPLGLVLMAGFANWMFQLVMF